MTATWMLLALLPTLGAGADGSAQVEPRSDTATIASRGHGLDEIDGELWGFGPRYKVRFDSGGFTYVPALGERAPRNYALSFRLESIARGPVEIHRAWSAVPPTQTGERVSYARGGGVVERYDVRDEGIEQSFELASLPPGSGDLVVRGRIETELVPSLAGAPAEALAFERDGLGGVSIGAVTGVDARGRQARGTLRFDGTHLELSLPAAFVDGAALPLVLDPLVGTLLPVSANSPGLAVGDPDVAYEAGTGRYLVVWEKFFSASDTDVFGQELAADGSLVAGVLLIAMSSLVDRNPTVASIRATGKFLVVWEQLDASGQNPQLVLQSVDAATRTFSGQVTLGIAGSETDPDAGGEATLAASAAIVVFRFTGPFGAAGVLGARVQVPASGDPSVLGFFPTTSDSTDQSPAISKSGGTTGRFLVTWVRTVAGDTDVYGVVYDRSGAVLTAETALANNTEDESFPDVDGDGGSWKVVFQRKLSVAPFDNAIYCTDVLYNGTSLVPTPPVLIADKPGFEDLAPAVAFAGEKYFVAWTRIVSDPDVYYVALAPQSCAPCEFETFVSQSFFAKEAAPEIAAQKSGDPAAGGGALLVFESLPILAGMGDIVGQRLQTLGPGGPVANMGGGCGSAGTISVVGPVTPGNSSFVVLLSGADPAASIGLLNVSPPSAFAITCGTCLLTPFFQTFAVPLFGGPGGKGAALNVPIPCRASFLGKSVELQWTVGLTSTTPCPIVPSFSITDRLSATFGL